MSRRPLTKVSRRPASKPARKANEVVGKLKPGQTPQEANAALLVAGLGSNAAAAWEWSTYPFGDVEKKVDLTATLNEIVDAAERVNRGDLGDLEALLSAQTVALNTLFVDLAHRANKAKYIDHFDRYLRLALKAQTQCRATCETLAVLKNPPVFARQANIAHGPQQVNNGMQPSRAGNPEAGRNELLEAHDERLDLGEAGTAGAGDQAMATVGTRDWPANG
jgi:hypothetical protein